MFQKYIEQIDMLVGFQMSTESTLAMGQRDETHAFHETISQISYVF